MRSIIAVLCLAAVNSLSAQTKDTLAVYFPSAGYRLTPSAIRSLDSIWNLNKTAGYGLEFMLAGHCDSDGSDQYNEVLSEKRAKEVQQHFISLGANRESFIQVIGAGESQPVNGNKTPAEKQLNRRVEIIILKTKKTEPISLKEKIADTAIKAGDNIVLKNINFVGGRHTFLQESMPSLQELLDVMKSNPTLVIKVEGHICCQPSSADGTDEETGLNNLSEARARAVCDYLFANGIAAARLSYTGLGHSAPLYPYPENNAEEMKLNRRVEIKIISK